MTLETTSNQPTALINVINPLGSPFYPINNGFQLSPLQTQAKGGRERGN